MNRELDEICRRLDAIERRLGMRDGDGHHHHDHHGDHHHHDDRRDFDRGGWEDLRGRDGGVPNEKRIVDLVVNLLGERVEEVFKRVLDERGKPPAAGG
jgi:hypothetical protein